MNACRYWRVHIGAHKTATTHFQDSLAAVSTQMLAHNRTYITRETFRAHGGLPNVHPARRLLKAAGLPVAALPVKHWLTQQSHHAEVLLLSEENLLGGASGLLMPVLYPQADSGLQRLREVAGAAKLSIFLSLRSLDTLLPSAYAQRCRFGRSREGDFDRVGKAALQQPLRWAALVQRLTRHFPPSDITIWRFEDYIRNPKSYLDTFVDIRGINFPSIPIPSETRSPSAEAIMATERLPQQLDRKSRELAAQAICENDTGSERFSPFSPDEARTLKSAYENDLSIIMKSHPGINVMGLTP